MTSSNIGLRLNTGSELLNAAVELILHPKVEAMSSKVYNGIWECHLGSFSFKYTRRKILREYTSLILYPKLNAVKFCACFDQKRPDRPIHWRFFSVTNTIGNRFCAIATIVFWFNECVRVATLKVLPTFIHMSKSSWLTYMANVKTKLNRKICHS